MLLYKNHQSFLPIHFERTPKIRLFIRKFFIVFVAIIFVFGSLYYFFSKVHFIDPLNHCLIFIKHDVISGDTDSILRALRNIKNTDFVAYKNICKYIDKIYEDKCVLGDSKTKFIHEIQASSCYIKGSKAILINPIPKGSNNIDGLREQDILNSYLYAKEFWESKD